LRKKEKRRGVKNVKRRGRGLNPPPADREGVQGKEEVLEKKKTVSRGITKLEGRYYVNLEDKEGDLGTGKWLSRWRSDGKSETIWVLI